MLVFSLNIVHRVKQSIEGRWISSWFDHFLHLLGENCKILFIVFCQIYFIIYTIPEDATFFDLKALLDSQVDGKICDNCRDIIMTEIGKQFFYIAALANTLNISLSEVLTKEQAKLSTLTIFNLT